MDTFYITFVTEQKRRKIMIELNVLDVCENCLNFCPVLADDFILTNLSGDTVFHKVTCESIDKCKVLLKHLRKETMKDGN